MRVYAFLMLLSAVFSTPGFTQDSDDCEKLKREQRRLQNGLGSKHINLGENLIDEHRLREEIEKIENDIIGMTEILGATGITPEERQALERALGVAKNRRDSKKAEKSQVSRAIERLRKGIKKDEARLKELEELIKDACKASDEVSEFYFNQTFEIQRTYQNGY